MSRRAKTLLSSVLGAAVVATLAACGGGGGTLSERTPDYVTLLGAEIHRFKDDFAVALPSDATAQAYWCAAAEYLLTKPDGTVVQAVRRQTGEFGGPIQRQAGQGLTQVSGRVVYFIDAMRRGDWDDRAGIDVSSEDTSLFGGAIRNERSMDELKAACGLLDPEAVVQT